MWEQDLVTSRIGRRNLGSIRSRIRSRIGSKIGSKIGNKTPGMIGN